MISKKIIIFVIAGVLILILAVVFFSRRTNPTQNLVTEVGKLMILPSNETPTVATVNDKDKLKGQAFFATAQNGDKVLIYTGIKKAILYRPSIHKIVDVVPVAVKDL